MNTMTNGIKKSCFGERKVEKAHWVKIHMSVAYEDGTRKRFYFELGVSDNVRDEISHVAEFFKSEIANGYLDKHELTHNGLKVTSEFYFQNLKLDYETLTTKAISFRLNRVNGITPKIKEYFL